MWFRTSRKKTSASSLDQVIERYRRQRATRTIVGVAFSGKYQGLVGTVTTFRGAGKWMRPSFQESLSAKLPDHLSLACGNVVGGQATVADTVATGLDLGEAAAHLVEELLPKAGIDQKDILAVCVDEPGARWVEYDGRAESAPIFQPQRFVERTGLNVIDGLALADMAAGGTASSLDALVTWLVFADRSRPVATRHRWLLTLDEESRCIQLPPSDGLDAELPEIRIELLPGFESLKELLSMAGLEQTQIESLSNRPPATMDTTGKESSESLAAAFQFARQESRLIVKNLVENPNQPDWQSWLELSGSQLRVAYVADQTQLESVWQAASEMIADAIHATAQSREAKWLSIVSEDEESVPCEPSFVDENADQESPTCSSSLTHHVAEFMTAGSCIDLVLSSQQPAMDLVIEELSRLHGAERIFQIADEFCPPEALESMVASVLGMMHIDQMPASVPWLTGCVIPRLHGRITPGRPAHWRSLINEMADYHPPAMKLRDAI